MRFVFLSLLILVPKICVSSDAVDQDLIMSLLNTAYVENISINNYEPDKFSTINNLLRSPGGIVFIPKAKKILLYGRILDPLHNPIKDSNIYIWQVDERGLYQYSPLKTNIDHKLISKTPLSSSFQGNGMSKTDNLGNFYFITILPKESHNLSPHINIRIEHKDWEQIQSKIFLTQQNKNLEKAFVVHKISPKILEYATKNKVPIYYVEIILQQ